MFRMWINHYIYLHRIVILTLASLLIFPNSFGAPDAHKAGLPIAKSASLSNTYLPLVARRQPFLQPFGVDSPLNSTWYLTKANAINAQWLRYYGFSWADIEPVRTNPPTYHWETVEEAGLQAAAEHGLQIIAIIKYTPAWAQKYTGVYCGPIAEANLGEFAQFMRAVVTRYGTAPYNIKYWELGNEPDVDYRMLSPTSAFGCWGDADDAYYGGGYYAEMLKKVYPAVKAVDPLAQVMNGGLLLNCDPTHPPSGTSCLPAKFLEGILRNGGGDYLDIVSYHGYAHYYGKIDESNSKWEHRGGAVLGKAEFLREVMQKYGVTKSLILSEASLLCVENAECYADPIGSGFYEAQADYVVWVYVRNYAADIFASIWYALPGPGWRSSGLLDGDTPKPAYYAYQFMTHQLAGSLYRKKVTQYPELSGYEFYDGPKTIWVLWATDQQDHVITLPENLITVYNKYGNVITPPGNQITVNSPIYIELNP